MFDTRRFPLAAIVLLVLLRIAIGWQFLYEGLWKFDTLGTANPWTARGYLVNAEGPFRDHFRGMVSDFPDSSDPDDLLWLDYDTVSAAWDRWVERFTKHYNLDEKQSERLTRLVDGPKEWTHPITALPERAVEGLANLKKIRDANPTADLPDLRHENGKLILSGKTPLKPEEVQQMYRWVNAAVTNRVEQGVVRETLAKADETGAAILGDDGQPVRMEDGPDRNFAVGVFALDRAGRGELGYRQKLAASLKGDPERAGVYKPAKSSGFVMGTAPKGDDAASLNLVRYGEIQKYQDELEVYNKTRAAATMPHEFDHLARLKTKLDGLKRAAVGPVKSLDADLKDAARALLTPEQIAKGPVPRETTRLTQASERAMWALLILGTLLILGLGTRIVAVAGAVLLMSFYLVVPPWPGVPEVAVGEHSFLINKNLIEALALFALAALPTGTWFGLDGVFRWLFCRRSCAAKS